MARDEPRPSAAGDPGFHTTRWSLVRRAGGGGLEARAGLEELCRAYWFPLYAFARRKGLSAADAEDAVQTLVAELLERGDLARADPARGRFRAFLRTALVHSLARAREREGAAKRGGGRRAIPIDAAEAEERLARATLEGSAPERAFERSWALELLERARRRLADEEAARGRAAEYARLAPALVPGAGPPRAELARALGTSEGAVKVALHRLRERFRAALRAEVADTLEDPSLVDAELAELMDALAD